VLSGLVLEAQLSSGCLSSVIYMLEVMLRQMELSCVRKRVSCPLDTELTELAETH
jgi:hypothetical protein